MKTNTILYLLLSSVAATSASDTAKEYNDTSISAEASINNVGDVELEDPKTTELINTIKEAVADGSFGDGDIFENYAANNGFGEELKHYEVIKFTSKGAIDINKKPMPDGVPEGFPKTRRAYMALRYSKDEKKKEIRYKDLYDDLVANEDEWLDFLDHLQNSEFAYECLRISYEYALIQQKKLNGQNWDFPHFIELADMMKKLIDIQQKYVGSISETGKELFEEIEFLATYFIWHNGLWRDPENEYGNQFKKLLACEVKVGWRPLVMQQWQTTRKQLKARGIHAPSNIDEVNDKVLYENLLFEVKKNEPYWKREDYGTPELVMLTFALVLILLGMYVLHSLQLPKRKRKKAMKPVPKKSSQGPVIKIKKMIYVKLSVTKRLNGNQGRKIKGLISKSGVEYIELEKKTGQSMVMHKIEASNGVVYVPVHMKGSEEAVQKAVVLIQEAVGTENMDEEIELPPTKPVSTTTAQTPKERKTSASKISSSDPPKIPKKKKSSTIWSSACLSCQSLKTITINTCKSATSSIRNSIKVFMAISVLLMMLKYQDNGEWKDLVFLPIFIWFIYDARTAKSVLIIFGILCCMTCLLWVYICQNPLEKCDIWAYSGPCDMASIERSIEYRNICQPFQTFAIRDLISWAIILPLNMFFLSSMILLLLRGVAYAPAFIAFLSLCCVILYVEKEDPCNGRGTSANWGCHLLVVSVVVVVVLFLSLLIILLWKRVRLCESVVGHISGILRMPFEIYQARKIKQTIYVKSSKSKNLSSKKGRKKNEIISKSDVDDIQIDTSAVGDNYIPIHMAGSRKSVGEAIELIQKAVGTEHVSITKPPNTVSIQKSASSTVNDSEPQPTQEESSNAPESPVNHKTNNDSGNNLAKEASTTKSPLTTEAQEEEDVPSEIGIDTSQQGMTTRDTITEASTSSFNDRSNISKAYSNFTLNENDPLLIFLRSQASCIKGSVDEFYTWLVKSEDIDSMLALKEAVNEDDYLNDMKVGDGGGSGIKGFKRKAFLRAISDYFNDESDTKSSEVDERKSKAANTNNINEPPEELVCPISLNLMTNDPVVAADGITYERASIEDWIQKSEAKINKAEENLKHNPHSEADKRIVNNGICSPVYGSKMESLALMPNTSLRTWPGHTKSRNAEIHISTYD